VVKDVHFFSSQPSIRVRDHGRLRVFVEAIFWLLRTGAQWRYLPETYGRWNSVYKRFNAWAKNGVWEGLFEHCSNDPDLELVSIDSTIVRAHSCSAGYRAGEQSVEGLGRSRGGFSSKIHALTDALGNPLKILVTEGNAADISCAHSLVQGYGNTTILADKGYDSNEFLNQGVMNGCNMVIPPRKHRKFQREYDKHVYKERHLIECFFGKIKHFRRIFSRFDKTIRNFTAFVYFACAHVWLR
jgi:transposase